MNYCLPLPLLSQQAIHSLFRGEPDQQSLIQLFGMDLLGQVLLTEDLHLMITMMRVIWKLLTELLLMVLIHQQRFMLVMDMRNTTRQIPTWLSYSTPDEFLESMKKSEAPLNVKYLQTLVECLCMLGKVAAAGAIICQRLRPTIHDIIISNVKAIAVRNSSRSCIDQATRTSTSDLFHSKGSLKSFQVLRQKAKNGTSSLGTQLVAGPVPPALTPMGTAQSSASELLSSILDFIIHILENHVVVGELLESKSSQQGDVTNTPKSINGDIAWNPDSESSQVTGGFSVGFSLTVIQSECQQLICEILRATPEAATADAAVQTARLANKAPVKEKRNMRVWTMLVSYFWSVG
ncbi:exocyst complex component SEC8 isoform X1 [Iris pallida]|uniref:Exocyst complex component Sec8 n=1 Tax=Iris pallida TaxID=29817 RepID=A0AAX6G5I7_IRIPA|nr:exocyst complex component SEC8 isoform X1 [Iris pallida]